MVELRRWTCYGVLKAGAHNKFYEVEAEEVEDGTGTWTFRWGRIGTQGSQQTSPASSFESARAICAVQWSKKTARGYKEVNAMEALAAAVEDVKDRPVHGLQPVEIAIPNFHAGNGDKRCQTFAQKYLDKLNVIRKSRWTLGARAYQKQMESMLKSYCSEWQRILKSKAHARLNDNAAAQTAMRIFFGALKDDAGCAVGGYFEGVGVC